MEETSACLNKAESKLFYLELFGEYIEDLMSSYYLKWMEVKTLMKANVFWLCYIDHDRLFKDNTYLVKL